MFALIQRSWDDVGREEFSLEGIGNDAKQLETYLDQNRQQDLKIVKVKTTIIAGHFTLMELFYQDEPIDNLKD